MATSFVFKTDDRVKIPVEIDCAVGSGKVIVHCRIKTQEEIDELRNRTNKNADWFDEIAFEAHGFPDSSGEPLDAVEALDLFRKGKLAPYLMDAFISAFFEHYGEARRKNGQRLPRR
jgi:hypothetical protein